jgi:hypothetical protein
VHYPTSGDEITRHFSWPETYRYLLPATETEVQIVVEGDTAKFTCRKFPVKGLLAYIDSEHGEEVGWNDNLYGLMPGETASLNVRGLNGRSVKTR